MPASLLVCPRVPLTSAPQAAVDVAARRKRPAKAGAGRGADQHGGGGSKRHPHQKGKAWVLKKKDQMRSKGVEVSLPHPCLSTC